MTTAARRLASFSAELSIERIPREVVDAAKLHLLDTLGCGLAAHALDTAPHAREAICEQGTGGPATIIGVPSGAGAQDAALVNGTTCHALDFDDTHAASVSHISVVVVPAALAVAETIGADGAALLTALVAGNEVSTRVGMAAGEAFHAHGFHPTAVCGVFGATAASARLRGLDPETMAQGRRRPVSPGDRKGHLSARAALANEHQVSPRAPALQDDHQALAGERVERMGDDDRFRSWTRPEWTGPMRGPSVCPASGACRSFWL